MHLLVSTPTKRRSTFAIVRWASIAAVCLTVAGCNLQLGKSERVLHGIVEVQEVRLASKVGGRVAKLLVEEGARVKAGSRLVELEAPELQARLASLEAQLRATQAKLAEAINGPLPEQHASSKAAVAMAEAKLANLEAGSREEELAEAQSQLNVQQESMALAQSEMERIKTLRATNAVTQADWDQAQSTWKQAAGRYEMARQRLRLLQAGSRQELISEAKAELQLRKAELALVERGTRAEELDQLRASVEDVEAKIAEAKANLAEAVVVAPEDCSIEVVSIRPGDIVAPNQPMIRIRLPRDRWIKAFIPETELGSVSVGETVEVMHDGSKQRYTGKISFIASASEFTPRNVQSVNERKHQVFGMKIIVDDAEDVFKSGMATRVYLPPLNSGSAESTRRD